MKITFIGTSSGKTSVDRYHSSLLFSLEKYHLLIDAGDGISRALLKNGFNFDLLNGILFTHLHPDHFSGLPALIVQMKLINRRDPLDIFIHKSLKTIVEEFLLRSYLLSERMGFKIHYKEFENDTPFRVVDNLTFLARENSHLNYLMGFPDKYPKLSLYSASFLFEKGNRRIIYTSDIGSEVDLVLFKEFIADTIITETAHVSPSAVIEKLLKLNPAKIYFTHYSDEDFHIISEILANLPSREKEKTFLAKDGLFFEI